MGHIKDSSYLWFRSIFGQSTFNRVQLSFMVVQATFELPRSLRNLLWAHMSDAQEKKPPKNTHPTETLPRRITLREPLGGQVDGGGGLTPSFDIFA